MWGGPGAATRVRAGCEGVGLSGCHASSAGSVLTPPGLIEELRWDTSLLWVSVSPCVSGGFLPYPQHSDVGRIKRLLEKM